MLKMLDKLLYELTERIIGKNGKSVIDILKDKRDVNEFKIAKKLNLTINQTRNLLYKLYAQDITSFIRKKDKQKGWYIYYWSFNNLKALELLARMREKELLQLSYLLKSRENKSFYMCADCDIELTEETALNHNFCCPECGNLLKLNEDKKKVNDLNKEIDHIKKSLESIYTEINILRKIEERKKLKREEKEKKLKELKRKRERKARKKAKIKETKEKEKKHKKTKKKTKKKIKKKKGKPKKKGKVKKVKKKTKKHKKKKK